MGHYDPITKIAYRNDGSFAYQNGFGSVTVVTPPTKIDSWTKDAARKIITDMDKKIIRRHVPQIGNFR